MSGFSYKNAKLFEKEIHKERQSQQELIQAVNADLQRQVQPFLEFRQRSFLRKLRWLFFGEQLPKAVPPQAPTVETEQ